MGKLISVWSPVKKTGKTLFVYNLLKQLLDITKKDINILICCVNFSYGNLLDMFKINENEINLEAVVNYKINPENELDLLKALARINNVYFIGSKKTTRNHELRYMNLFESLIRDFKHTFDLVVFDSSSGRQSALTNYINKECDAVINLLNQDIEMLDTYPFVNEKDYLYVVNKYVDIYPNDKDISDLYKIKPVFNLPLCNELQEMKNRGKLEFYWQHDTAYNRAMRNISELVAEKMDIEYTKQENIEDSFSKKKGLFGLFRGVI